MTRSSRPSAAATARERTLADFTRTPENWRAHATRKRAICKPVRRQTIGSIASLRNVSQTLHNDAVEST
eukprot:27931-Lingulodinium_polyedra.AAC.1